MEFEHYLHADHKLGFMEVGKENDTMCCWGCMDIINGPAYACTKHKSEFPFAMHKSCVELPPQIQRNSFHPHPLRIIMFTMIVCDGCRELSHGIISYSCMYCVFNLDFKSALAVLNDEKGIAKHDEEDHQGTTIDHFSHEHQLIRTRCKYFLSATKMGKEDFEGIWKSKCMACKQELQGTVTYTCLPCEFVLHESCTNDMPKQVQSPFHPQHVLLPRAIHKDRHTSIRCCACGKKVKGIGFHCNKCDVNLHVSCAKYQTRAIKHNCHPHSLLHLGKSIISRSCDACHKDCSDSFFSCIKCDFAIHLGCIPLPSNFKHSRHLHPLVLVNPFVEDSSGDYYCDMCETKRNAEHHVYYCEECNYIAHIDCVVSEVLDPTEEMLSDTQRMEENSDKMDDESLQMEGMVRYEKKIQKDAFHPHPLTLDDDSEALFICDGCEELCNDLSYKCSLCSFNLDIRCATIDDEHTKHEAQKVRDIKTTINHFSHNHQLRRCKINILQLDPESDLSCVACRQGLCGQIYTCLYCEFFLHESCFKDMPMQLRSLFHPQHNLLPFPILEGSEYECAICSEDIKGIAFVCVQCNKSMHYSCAKHKTRETKHNCPGDHHLQHFGKSIFFEKYPLCDACGQACDNTLFCCRECDFHIHLECIPLPYIVKHKRHLHPLTLTDSVVEDNSETYYCDMCEAERNPEHEIYYCEECSYISHIDCVISEVEPPEKIFQYLVSRPRKEGRLPQMKRKWRRW